MVPWLADRVDTLKSFDDVKLLDVQLNRLRRWYSDGALLIGDAAHAMSPVGGVGINLAVADAVAAARILAGPLRAGRVSGRQLARVQARRWVPTALLQATQRTIHANVIAAAVGGGEHGTAARRAVGGPIAGIAAIHGLHGGDRPAARARAQVRPTPRVNPDPTPDVGESMDAGRLDRSMMSGWSCTPNPPTSPPTPATEEAFPGFGPESPWPRPSTSAPPAPFASSGALRNPFPPIADYAFLSDWETTCLISPAGAVEWLCVPRPDSPSVFGAILDRSAGHFRLGPLRRLGALGPPLPARQPDHGDHLADPHRLADRARRAGDGAVARHRAPSRTHRRTPMDWDAEHILLRTVRCVSGTVELMMSCEPAFDYHRVGATWEYSANAYGEAIARASKQPDAHRRCG